MEELLHKLGIDWRLLIAQLVNFLIVFLLLRRILYVPVLTLLRERRQRIAKGLADAATAERRLADVELERQAILQRAETERRSLLEAAAADAETLRHQRLVATEQETAARRERAEREAAQVRADVLAAVRTEVGDLVLAITGKVVSGTLPKSAQVHILESAATELEHAKL